MEDLMIPRYKVIAGYPGAFAIVESVLDEDVIINYLLQHDEYDINKYPHLFKKLQWWEERTIREMPMNVKVIQFNISTQLPLNSIHKVNVWQDLPYRVAFILGKEVHVRDLEPATEEQYNNYINSKK